MSPDQLVQCRLTDGVAQHAGEWSDAGHTGDVDDVPLAGGQVGGGGFGSDYDYLSSTELLVESSSAWVSTGSLPSPRYALRGANIDGKVLMTGN